MAFLLDTNVLLELRKGKRAKNPKQCPPFETWLSHLMDQYQDDILPINIEIVERWGELNARNPMPVIDSLIAASALEYRLTVVTRNTRDFAPTKVPVVNPF